ncbi:type II toxin-antitoxin system HicA family toxin [Catalinimonas niigatensis]|uniref:type II toxin-antitoxin system HicA family toxin n=1 Tax=Catalinimonas niigatensis TaxID=1397264 RepID=UPI002664E72C|nr:type II toxin-antitoxin system HicA family toxin [Catalinimonas niigatensis]WPP52960.1 type II toxin-antitoxin system HicA family toxin [Catalinimonas niigatensis]
MKYKEVIKVIENDGWAVSRQRGSYRVYKHSSKKGIVIIAAHRLADEVPPGTLSAILKQAGLK